MNEPTSVVTVAIPRSSKERLREVAVAQDRPMSVIVGEFLEPAIAAGWERRRRPLSAVMARAHVAWARRWRPDLLQPWLNR